MSQKFNMGTKKPFRKYLLRGQWLNYMYTASSCFSLQFLIKFKLKSPTNYYFKTFAGIGMEDCNRFSPEQRMEGREML